MPYEATRTFDPRPDRPFYDTPARAAMNAHRSPVRDGRTCDQCGLPNLPRGWSHSDWPEFIDYPHSMQEGYGGLVLCAACYVGHVESGGGPARALEVALEILRSWQRRAEQGRAHEAARQARVRATSRSEPEGRSADES